MAVLEQTFKIVTRTDYTSADITSINGTVDAYLANAPDGVAEGANVCVDVDLDQGKQGVPWLFVALLIGKGEGAYVAAARRNETQTFSVAWNGAAANITTLETAVNTWLANGGDGIAAGAPVHVTIDLDIRDNSQPFLVATVAVGSENSLIDGDTVTEFNVEEWGDDTAGDGSVIKPFATIQAAVNAIIARGDNALDRPYKIKVGSGEFTGTVTLEDAALVNIEIQGAGSAQTILDPTAGNAVESETDNDGLRILRFRDLRFLGPVVLEGESNATDFGTGLLFWNCYFDTGGTLSVTNSNQCVVVGAGAFLDDVTISNVAFYVSSGTHGYNAGITWTIEGDGTAPKVPSGWGGTTVAALTGGAQYQPAITITGASDDVTLYLLGCSLESALVIPAGTVLYADPGTRLQDALTVAGAVVLEGSCNVEGAVNVTGTITARSSYFADVVNAGAAGTIYLYACQVYGNIATDAAAVAFDMYGGGYLGTLTDTGGVFTYTDSNPLMKAGRATIADLATTAAVAFAVAYPNANYSVVASAVENTAGLANVNVWCDTIAAGGFNLNISAAPGAGNSIDVHWIARLD